MAMSERKTGVPEERIAAGQEIYVESMEKSSVQKYKEIRPFVHPGVIYDMGAGAGALTQLFCRDSSLSGSTFIAIDNSEEMVERMSRRFHGEPNVKVELADSVDYVFARKADTIIRVSHNHEIFSYYGHKHEPVKKALENDFAGLVSGGREIVRDGVEPEPETLYVRPISEFAVDRFGKFIRGFSGVRQVDFSVGRIDPNKLSWKKTFDKPNIGSVIKMASRDVNELLSKYFYSDVNLSVELTEQFGIWTLSEYKKVMKSIGFSVLHSDTFLLQYLLDNHYSKDFEIYRLRNSTLTHAPYPASTMLLVAEKP
jgi:SAM-dependent methyltransferase